MISPAYKGCPPSTQTRLQSLETTYGLTSSEVRMSWELLALSNPQWRSHAWPQDESSLKALQLEAEKRVSKKKKQSSVQKPMQFSDLESLATPPNPNRANKRQGISPAPPVASVKRHSPISMDVLKAAHPFVSPGFVGASAATSTAENRRIKIEPGDPWTKKWFAGAGDYVPTGEEQVAPRHLYMSSTLEEVAEKLRGSLMQFAEDALKSGLLKSPKTLDAAEPATIIASQEESFAATAFDPVGSTVHGRNVLVCGRIVCEAENGKLNAKSVLLEGINGVRVRLDFDFLTEKFSLFPGQHVAIEGTSTGSAKIRVVKFYDGTALPAPGKSQSSVSTSAEDVKIWIASGPYTSEYDLKFEYLDELIAQVSLKKPEVLILLGPFVDVQHPHIASGRPSIQAENARGEMETYNNLAFEDVFSFFLARVLTVANTSPRTRICLVPSTDDVTNQCVAFPQPALFIPEDVRTDDFFCSLPNPATIEIADNVRIGVANIDTLFDFQDEGSPCFGYEPRETLPRLAGQALRQHSYYPIVPPSPESSVDVSFRAELTMPAVDVLLVPSKLQCFAQDVGGVLCINPGKSVTKKTKMSIAQLNVVGGPGGVAENRAKVEFFAIG